MFANEWTHYPAPPPPHESNIHNAVFGALSRPISSLSDHSNDSTMKGKMFQSSAPAISWNHFGKKYRFQFTEKEFKYSADIYQTLLRKILHECPEFKEALAFTNSAGKEIHICDDSALRLALEETGNQLKLHTVLNNSSFDQDRCPSVLAASEMLSSRSEYKKTQAKRSYSVPPKKLSAEFSTSSRSPNSQESGSRLDHNRNAETGMQRYQRSRSPSVAPYSSYSAYNYTQPLLYGMPPQNLLLSQLLLAGAGHYYYPGGVLPFFAPSISERWVGPNKYHNWGGSGRQYYKSGWGPVW